MNSEIPPIKTSTVEGASAAPHPTLLLAGIRLPLEKRILNLPTGPLPHWLPAYVDSHLESIAAARPLQDRHWPYWLEDWPASWELASIGNERAGMDEAYPMADVGCGSGWLACALAPYLKGPYHAIDFNREACALGAYNWSRIQKKNESSFSRVHFICADATALPIQIKYQTLFGGEMLYHPETRALALQVLTSHLAQEGRAYFADSGRAPADSFTLEAHRAGFQVELHPMGPSMQKPTYRIFSVSWKPKTQN